VHQNGFNLVVGVVTYGHFMGRSLSGHPPQKVIATVAGGLFERVFVFLGKPADILGFNKNRQLPPFG
jgi:hypothetical protein